MSPAAEEAARRWCSFPSGKRGIAELVGHGSTGSCTAPSKFDLKAWLNSWRW